MNHFSVSGQSAHPLMGKTLAELQDILASDPAMIGVVRRLLFPDDAAPAAKEPPPPFPTISAITAIQTAIWDNWPNGRPTKAQPNRYGCTIEIWTKSAERIRVAKRPNCDHKSSMALMNRANLRRQIKRLRNHRTHVVDPAYLDAVTIMADGMDDTMRIGLLNVAVRDDRSTHPRGTYYQDHGFVVGYLDDKGTLESMRLCLMGEALDLADFDPCDAAGNYFSDNPNTEVVLQSRHDLCGFSTSWGSQKPENVTASLI